MQKDDHTPRSGQSRHFDAGQWLIWAERLGYRIYLSKTGPRGRLGIVTEVPNGPRGADDLDLWRAFQGKTAERKVNRAALIAHLVKIGRVVHRAGPSAAPADSGHPTGASC